MYPVYVIDLPPLSLLSLRLLLLQSLTHSTLAHVQVAYLLCVNVVTLADAAAAAVACYFCSLWHKNTCFNILVCANFFFASSIFFLAVRE